MTADLFSFRDVESPLTLLLPAALFDVRFADFRLRRRIPDIRRVLAVAIFSYDEIQQAPRAR